MEINQDKRAMGHSVLGSWILSLGPMSCWSQIMSDGTTRGTRSRMSSDEQKQQESMMQMKLSAWQPALELDSMMGPKQWSFKKVGNPG